jgi:hypothetical protein
MGNPVLDVLIVLGAGVATLSVALSDLLSSSRTVFAMARNGDLPQFLSHKSPLELIGGLVEKIGLIHPEQAPFFTPGPLVKLMVDESFKALGFDRGRMEDKEFLIFDPSFGAGNFLLGLLRKMVKIAILGN